MYFNLLTSISFSLIYVLSLYFWKNKENRNTTNSIKKRSFSVLMASLICFIICYFLLPKHVLFKSLGIQTSILSNLFGTLSAFILTSILFFGPLVHILLDNLVITEDFKINIKPIFQWFTNFLKEIQHLIFNEWNNNDFQTVRNLIIGPFTEEFVFRSCICSILIQSFNQNQTNLISSLLFGIAHTHHIIELLIYQRKSLSKAILIVTIQLTYTTIFACFCCFIFLRTSCLLPSIFMHSYCNYLGLPDFSAMKYHKFKNSNI
eukprot:gene4410-7785_t